MEKKTTLVVVDFQYDFCLLGAPLYVPGSDKALWNISHLIENKKVDRVIFTADWHPANHCSFKRNGGEWNDHCVQFSKGAAIHDLLLYGCIGAGIPYEVLTKGVLPSSEEYGVKVAPATIRVNYHTIYSHSMGIDINPDHLHFWKFNDSPTQNRQNVSFRYYALVDAQPGNISVGTGNDRGGEEDEVEAIGWIPVDSIDKYQWAFGHDEIIKEFTEWMHLEDGDLDMQDIDLDPV